MQKQQMQIQKNKAIKSTSGKNNTILWAGEFRLPLSLAPEILDMTAFAIVSDLTEGLGYLPLNITGDEFTASQRNITITLEGVGNNIPYPFLKLKEVYGDKFIILNSL